MPRIHLILLLVSTALINCVGATKPSSEWDGLDSAEKVACEEWPKPEGAISVRSVTPLIGSKIGFIASYNMRNGSTGHYYLPFNDSEDISMDGVEARNFGAGSLVAGGGVLMGQLLLGVIQSANGLSKLELRSVADNVVRYAITLPAKDIKAPKIAIKGNDVWLQYREADDETAVEDARVGFIRITPKEKTFTVSAHVPGLPPGTEVVANDDTDIYAIAVWGEKTGASAKTFKFFAQAFYNDPKTKSKASEIDFPIEAGVESWSIAEARKGFFLGVVDGDSLVGQSNLRLARIFWQDGYQKVSWVKTRSLLNQHVSDAAWVKHEGKRHLVMPKWVDAESTLGIYSVSDTDIDNVKALGIFPTSVRLLELFKGSKSNEVFALLRSKNKGAARFDLCNLGGL